VIPLRETTVELTQQELNYMLVGAFELIQAKQAEYDAYQEYVEAVRDYWIARTELERAVGGALPVHDGAPRAEPHTGEPRDADGTGSSTPHEGRNERTHEHGA
jgi:cobalt-zinc-cadmium efflux system outer membrane protein